MLSEIFTKEFIFRKLTEKSNWALAITWLVGVAGYQLAPEFKEEVITVCTAITAAIAVYLNDKKVVTKKGK